MIADTIKGNGVNFMEHNKVMKKKGTIIGVRGSRR